MGGWKILAAALLVLAGCTASPDPTRERIVQSSEVVRDAQGAASRARTALDAGRCVTDGDRRILSDAWKQCTYLSETCEASYDAAFAAGESAALDANKAAINIGNAVIAVRSAVYWIVGVLGIGAVIFLALRFSGSIVGFLARITGRAGLVLLVSGIALATIPRSAPAATAFDPVEAKLVEVAIRDRHSLGTLRALIQIESSGRPRVVNARSGAAGLMQLKAATARGECGLQADERLDPLKNIDCGSRYLRKMRDRFGSLRGGLMGYFMGPSGYSRRGLTAVGRRYLWKFEKAGGVL